jgi:hypothetical protein
MIYSVFPMPVGGITNTHTHTHKYTNNSRETIPLYGEYVCTLTWICSSRAGNSLRISLCPPTDFLKARPVPCSCARVSRVDLHQEFRKPWPRFWFVKVHLAIDGNLVKPVPVFLFVKLYLTCDRNFAHFLIVKVQFACNRGFLNSVQC